MSEVVAESVQTQSDPDSISWRSLDVVGPFTRLVEAIEEAERLYRGHKLLLV